MFVPAGTVMFSRGRGSFQCVVTVAAGSVVVSAYVRCALCRIARAQCSAHAAHSRSAGKHGNQKRGEGTNRPATHDPSISCDQGASPR